MLSEMAITRIEQELDDMYTGRDTVARGEIVSRAETAPITDEMMTFFAALPDGSYTRRALSDAFNGMVDAVGSDVGHIH
jgi:hypothetical protein